MSEWKEYKLGDVVTFQRGHDLPKTEMLNGDIPVAGSNGIIGYHDKYTTVAPGLTIGRSGNIGTPHFYQKPFWAHNTVLFVKDFHGNIEKFIYYFLKTIDFTQFNTGSAVPSLNRNHIHELDILLPPLDEQERIVEILSSLDDKIDLLGRQNATLEAMAETLFRQYFIENPKEDWKEGKLSDLIEVSSGYAYKGEYIGLGDSLLLGMGCVSYNHRFLYNGARLYAGNCPNSFRANGGDIVVATRQQSDNMPILGAPAIIPYELKNKNIIVGTNLYRVKNKSSLSNYCIYLLMRSDDYRKHIDACSKGSTVKMITKDSIESFPIMIPPHDHIVEHQDYFCIIDQRLINNISQIRSLTKLRDTLLPKLMNNEIKICP